MPLDLWEGWESRYTGAIIQWKGKEPFAGDQVQTLLENGALAWSNGIVGMSIGPEFFYGFDRKKLEHLIETIQKIK